MSQRNTLETCPATTVLAVGTAPAVLEIVRQAASAVPTAEVESCDLKAAPTRVAELWPFVIVMSEDLYAFDAPEFDALARDVSARLITIASEPKPAFVRELGHKIAEAFARRTE